MWPVVFSVANYDRCVITLVYNDFAMVQPPDDPLGGRMNEIEVLEAQREATATIRGYLYQFDASILVLLAAKPDEWVTVEGVEDFDIASPSYDTYGQVKYYEAQKLTDSTLRDAITPMLRGFLRNTAEQRARKKYILYGHFKQAPDQSPTTSLTDLKRMLVQRHHSADGTGKKVHAVVNLQKQLGASDDELSDFGSRLTIALSPSFDDHRAHVIAELKSATGVSTVEAEGYIYPSAQTAMGALCCAADKVARTTTRQDFLQKIRPNIAVYSAWALREESEQKYCSTIRRLYFSNLNVDSRERFFIVTLPASDALEDIHGLVQHIVARWSSYKINKKPNKERYAPIFFFPKLDRGSLVSLKKRLYADGQLIADGYAFCGANFDAHELMRLQTRDWPVSARFVSDSDQFTAALSAAQRPRLVIQLYAVEPQEVDPSIQQIAIPIVSANMARKIV